MAVQLIRYSVCTWGNKETGELWYGVRVWIKGKGWAHVCEGANPVLLLSRKQAQDFIKKMKSERDKHGFLKAA